MPLTPSIEIAPAGQRRIHAPHRVQYSYRSVYFRFLASNVSVTIRLPNLPAIPFSVMIPLGKDQKFQVHRQRRHDARTSYSYKTRPASFLLFWDLALSRCKTAHPQQESHSQFLLSQVFSGSPYKMPLQTAGPLSGRAATKRTAPVPEYDYCS